VDGMYLTNRDLKEGDKVYLRTWDYCMRNFGDLYCENGLNDEPTIIGIYEKTWNFIYNANPHIVDKVYGYTMRIQFSSLSWRVKFFSLDGVYEFFSDKDFEL